MLQLDFFKTKEEVLIEDLLAQVKEMKKSQNKVRRKLFAEMTETKKKLKAIEEEFDSWKSTLCREKSTWKDFPNLLGPLSNISAESEER